MRLIRVPTQHPVLTVCASVFLTVFFSLGLIRVEIDSSIRTMLVDNDPAHSAHDEYTNRFGTDEVLSLAIEMDDSLSLDSLKLQDSLAKSLRDIKGVVDVEALVTQDDVFASGDDLVVRPLVEQAETVFGTEGSSDWLKERVRHHPIWLGWLISDDLSTIAFQIELADSPGAQLSRPQTFKAIESAIARVLPGREYHFAGHPFMKLEIGRSIARDLARLLPISMLVMTLALLVVTRSFVIGIATSSAVLLSVIWMVGAMGWLGLDMTALTNAAPTILVALSTAYVLHLSASFQSQIHPRSPERAEAALAAVWRPTWIAAATTALGYASLSLSSVPIVRGFGLSLSIGVILAALVGMFFLPALLSLLRPPKAEGAFGRDSVLAGGLFRVAQFVARFNRVILICSVGIFIISSLVAMQITVDSSGPKRFAEDSRFRRSSEFYRKKLSGDVLESVYLQGDTDDFLDPGRLRRLQQLAEAAQQLPEIDKVISIADYVARIYWVFRGEKGDPLEIPDSPEAVSQLLVLYESSGDGDGLSDYLSSQRDSVRIVLKADVQSSSESAQLRRDLRAIAGRFFPVESQEYSVISTEMLLSEAADVISIEQMWSAAIALILIILLIAGTFRSVAAAGLMIAPNVLPLSVYLGVMVVAGIALSDATSIIAATSIGIAVDSTVHLLNATREAQAKLGSRRAAVLYSLVVTGRPVVVSSAVVVLGFSILLFSEFQSVAELGGLTALTMIFCLVADLLVLPAQLISGWPADDKKRAMIFATDNSIFVGVGMRMSEGIRISSFLGRVKRDALPLAADWVEWLDSGEVDRDVTLRMDDSPH